VVSALVCCADCPYNAVATTPDSTDCGDVTEAAMTSRDDVMSPVECRLENKQLWDKFHELGTEMIITKSGRYVALQCKEEAAIADGPRDALSQLKSCLLLHNCTKNHT